MRRFLAACLIILAACSRATTSPPTTTSSKVATTVAPLPGILSQCETPRPSPPLHTEFDAWDSPGVITTDVEIDLQGNKIISGYMTDENDFNYKDSYQTVGVDGYGFEFVAKFNPRSEFEWIHCLKETSLYHFYDGPDFDSDVDGNIYVCGSTLTRWNSAGKFEWSKDFSHLSQLNCAVSSDGYSLVSGEQTLFVSPLGDTIWTKDTPEFYEAQFLSDGNIALATNSSLAVISREGLILWEHERIQRCCIGPYGDFSSGANGNSLSTDQTGIASDIENIVIATTLNKAVDFDPSSKVTKLSPLWIQEAVVAKYSLSGKMQWAQKISLPRSDKTSARFVEIFDTEINDAGEILIYGGGTASRETDPESSEPMHLFFVKFSPAGQQMRFLWLDEYTYLFHNLGRYFEIDSRGRLYATAESLTVPPFLLSRDL